MGSEKFWSSSGAGSNFVRFTDILHSNKLPLKARFHNFFSIIKQKLFDTAKKLRKLAFSDNLLL